MCGIGGFVAAPHPAGAAYVPNVEALLRSLSHRGPDGRGWARSGRATFAVSRLAIRSPGDGVQPVVDPATGILAVCNGEIDNHRSLRRWLASRGRSVPSAVDVAVLPGLYLELGAEFVSRLEGPFAIALWDPRAACLVLARDRAGEKSLFFTERPTGVAFASEIAALVNGDPALAAPDSEALAGYLERGFFTPPRTPLAEVRKVAPGERVIVDDTRIRHQRYWRFSFATQATHTPNLARFDRVLCEAVERATEVDVDFGVLLSGGVDSSLLAAVARRVRPLRQLVAYTVRFDEDSYDEGAPAQRVARWLGIEPVEARLRAADVPGLLADLVSHAGEPLADPAWLPLAVIARRAALDVRMLLSGEGADELFGGYPTYFGPWVADGWMRLPQSLRRLLERSAEALPASDRKVTIGFLAKRFVRSAELGGLERHLAWVASMSPDVLVRLGAKTLRSYRPEPPAERLLDVLQTYDFETALAEGLLTKADRGAMRWGVEIRAPFLAPGIIDFAATLHASERVHGLRTKVFLKRHAERHLPHGIVHRRKRGLSVPLAGWLRGPLSGWARTSLSSGRLDPVGIRPDAALELLDEHVSGRHDHARALWTLLVLAEWFAWLGRVRGDAAARP